ncbi:amidase family protein [Maribacter sp. 2308TA10-17]|uniref:amidase family protein n=1 Tax=Maribacter sp. 2308TA10-17 TaxID=3386276 RepID=UPI0039BC4700
MIKNKTSVEQIEIFKKDIQTLETYLLSLYDTINLDHNKSLNLFTTDPNNNKHLVINSLKGINKSAPLFGLPIVVKDNFNTSDFPTSAGTPALENFIPKTDAELVKKLRDAGAIVMGKTNMHELAFGLTSNNRHFGPVKNPYDSTLFAGGSSGGTAAAVKVGVVNVGLGTDTGGSCRVPAALCGVFGFRPTAGVYSSEGVVPLSTTRDTPGLIAKSMEEIILLDEVITNQSNDIKIDAKSIRIGIPRAYFYDNLSSEVSRISEETIQKLKSNGIQLVEIDIEGIPELLSESINIVFHETYLSLNKYLEKHAPGISYEDLTSKISSPDVKGLFDSGAINTNETYDFAITEERPRLQRTYQEHFDKYDLDVLLFPTSPVEARPIAGCDETIELNGKQVPTFPTLLQNMNPSSYAGIPGISIPAGVTKEGLPVGIHLESPEGSDKKLLKIASMVYELIK